jgi:UDPglucose 6-dehydrogenase
MLQNAQSSFASFYPVVRFPVKISVIGTGYVGAITAAGLAKLGHGVTCVDVDRRKVDLINSKTPPIFEEGLPGLLAEVVPSKLGATLDLAKAVQESEVTFICVGTPSAADGSIDLSYIRSASAGIGAALKGKNGFHVVVMKSTVVPGTCETVAAKELEKASGKKAGKDFGIAMVPEFLREGKAIEDFFSPDRIVAGTSDDRTKKVLESLFSSFSCPTLWVDVKTAEMIKYASNSFLAAKISFINELGNFCKTLGIDTYKVADGIGLDSRIGRKFLNSGCGFGGSCFPKDVSALQHLMKSKGFEPILLDAVMEVNRTQPLRMVDVAERRAGSLSGKAVAVLGLAFKPGTDDVRDSPAIPIVETLLEKGARIIAFDPQGMENFKRKFPNAKEIEYAKTAQEAIDKSDVVLLVTDWPAFNGLNYGSKNVIDGKNVLDYESRKKVKNYEGICW